MSYTQIYYHIIFSTKNREPVLVPEARQAIYKYLWGILDAKQCHLYRMGGAFDHIHMLTHIHPAAALAGLVRDLKASSTAWIKSEQIIPKFPGWQSEYAAFTKGHGERDKIITYIKGQEKHHAHVSFIEELKAILAEEGVSFDERYLQ